MPAYRFFLDTPLTAQSAHTLPKEERHHIVRVMRCRPGQELEIVNGRGDLAHAVLLEEGRVQIQDVHRESPPLPLILIQAIPKLNRLDFIVEKGTELGMTALWLFPGERSEKQQLSPTQMDRLIHLSIAALKQCGRLTLPSLLIKPSLHTWTQLPQPAYFGSLDPAAPWLTAHPSACCVIGPEGGLTEREEASLQTLGALPIKLHTHILRTDTASLVALSLLTQHPH